MGCETPLRRDWRAILRHGYGVTFLTMPVALVGAIGEMIKSGELILPYLLLFAYGLVLLIAVLTGRTILTPDEVVSGSIFRRQRISRHGVRAVRSVSAGVTAFNLSSIVLHTDGGVKEISLSRGLGAQRQFEWVDELEVWLPENQTQVDSTRHEFESSSSPLKSFAPSAIVGTAVGISIAAIGPPVLGAAIVAITWISLAYVARKS